MADVKNCELAKSSPTQPTAGYDKAMGTYKDEAPAVNETAVKSLPMSAQPRSHYSRPRRALTGMARA